MVKLWQSGLSVKALRSPQAARLIVGDDPDCRQAKPSTGWFAGALLNVI